MTHTPEAGANRLLVLVAGMENIGERYISSATFGGQPLTFVVEESLDLSGKNSAGEIWYLTEAGIQAATDNTFVVNYDGSPSSFQAMYTAATFQDVDQASPIVATESESSTEGATIATMAFPVTIQGMSIAGTIHGSAGSFDDSAWGAGWSEGADFTAGNATLGAANSTSAHVADGSDFATSTHSSAENRQVLAAASLRSALSPTADLQLTKIVDNAFPQEGDTIIYTLQITNAGPEIATGVNVTEILPAGLTYVSDASSSGNFVPGNGQWNLGSLPTSAPAVLTLVATVDGGTAGTTITNSATAVLATPVDLVMGNNSASAEITVQGGTPGPIQLVSLPLERGHLRPGGEAGDVLHLILVNQGTAPDMLLSLTVANATTGPGSAADLDRNWEDLSLLVKTGENLFPPPTSQPGAVITGAFNAGILTFTDLALGLAPGDSIQLVIQGRAALGARDGDLLSVQISDDQALLFASSTASAANWPLVSEGLMAVDGMVADQLDLRPLDPTPFSLGSPRNLALDVGLPANGYEGDQMDRLNIINTGNAIDGTDITRMEAWADEGDGNFDPGTDTLLGEFAYTGVRWELTGLSHVVPLTRLRVYITVDIAENGTAGRTIQLGLPSLPDVGIGMVSGNDGPIDREVVNPFAQSLSTADRVILSTGVIVPGTVLPGDADVPLLHLVALNSYTDSRLLSGMTIMNGGNGPGSPTDAQRDGELNKLTLRLDGDGDGQLGDPLIDPVIATGLFSGGQSSFSGLDLNLAPGTITHLFLTGDVSLTGAADGDILSAYVAGGIDLDFGIPTALAASWPLDSGASWMVDGMVAAQVVNTPVPAVTLAAGEGPALVLDLVVPANGYLTDTLVGLHLINLGTATDSDIADLRLWRDGGDGIFSAGAGDDLELGPCALVNDAWHSPVLNVPLPQGGMRIFAGITVDAAPTDAATVRLAVPVDGIIVDSGNIGPHDHFVESTVTTLLSTAPLLAQVQIVEPASTIGQTVTARMRVRNVGNEDLLGVAPLALVPMGDGTLAPTGGPVPASLDLAAGAVDSFTWTFTAATTGTISLTSSAQGTGAVGSQLRSSLPSESGEHRILDPATGLDLFAVANMPFTLNRGQTDIVPLSLTFINSGGTNGADGLIRSLRISLKDAAGAGIVPADLLTRVVVNEGGITYLDKTTLETTGDQVDLTLTRPVPVTHLEPVTLSLRLDIRQDTTVPAYMVEITSDAWFEVNDAVNGSIIPVVLQEGSFPIQSGLGTLLVEATNLQVTAENGVRQQVGVGQQGVTLLAMELLNPGTSGLGSEIRVGSLGFSLTDTLGTPLAVPSQVLKSLRVESPLQTLLEISVADYDSTTVILDFVSSLTVPVDTPLPLTLYADINDPGMPGAVQARLADTSSFLAVDGNSGAVVPVIYGSDPLAGDTIVVQEIAAVILAQGEPLLPGDLVLGARNVAALDIALRHPGSSSEAAILVESLVVQSRNGNRDLIPPTGLIDQLVVLHEGTPVGSVSNPTGDGNMVISLPGIVLQPVQTLNLTLEIDLEAAAPVGSLELLVPGAGLVARDANLLSSVTVLPDTGENFPLTSGVARLQESADELLVGFTSLMPPVLVDTGMEFPAAEVSLRNPDQGGNSGIDLASVTIRATDDQQVFLPVGSAVEEIFLYEGDEIWASSGPLASDDSLSTLEPDGAVFIGPGVTLDLEMRVRFRSPPTVQGLRLGVASGDILVSQPEGSLVTVRVEPEVGQLFPFWTEVGSFSGASLSESYSNFPNPFGAGQEATTFVFSLERPATISLTLLTAHSWPVISLIENELRPSGLYQNDTWDGRNGRGILVQNGVYIAELIAVYADGTQDRQLRKVAVVR